MVTVYAKVQDGSFEEVSFTGRGCSISQASASMLTEQLTGKSREEAEEKIEAFLEMMRTEEKEARRLKGVVQTPNRIRCATLAWDAMRRALPHSKYRRHRALPRRSIIVRRRGRSDGVE